MNTPRNRYLLFAVVLLLFVMACGGTEPDTESIPAFPEAETITGEESFVVGLLEGIADSTEEEGFEVTTEFYSLPDDASFEDVEAFYDEELTARDWTKADSEDIPDMDTGGAAGWEHGRNQAFLIMVMPDEMSDINVLMTMEAVQ
jgi:hypothetical protein